MPPDAPKVVSRYVRSALKRVLDPLAYVPAPSRPPTETPVAGVVGYYGYGNYGDELFLEVFREHLEPPIVLRPILDPRAGRFRHRAIGPAVRRSDVLLIGGGDIVIPWGGGRYWERAFLRRPVFVAGVAVPTWGTTRPERLDPLRAFFRHPNVRYIGVRDPVSAGWIRDRLEPLAPVITTPDLVCALSLPAVERPMDPPIFGVAVRRRRGKDDLSAVRSLCRRAIELGYRVRQIVLATGAVRLRDAEVTAELGIAGAEVVASDDLTTITRAIGECTAMASMKFHGVVVASMYGIPCFVLMPTAKNRYFVEALGRLDLLSHFGDHELADRLTRDPRPIDPAVVDRLRRDAVASLVDLRGRMIAAAAGRDAVPSAAQVEVDAAPAATTADEPDPQPAGPVR